MIRSATRQFISGGHHHHSSRGWSSNIGQSIGAYYAPSSSYQYEGAPNNINTSLCLSKRLMSSSNSGGSDQSQSIDGGNSFTVPSFGSSPISPEESDITTTSSTSSISTTLSDETTTKIAEQIAAFEPTWWPSDQALLLLNWVNESCGMPNYAMAIGATTIGFRALLFPLFVKGQRNSSRMGHMQPELAALKDELEKMGNKIDQATQQRHIQQTRALFKKYDCNPLVSIAAPLATMPIFMSMFFALRRAPELFPDLLSTGGMLWFTDLTAPDPYVAMPIMSMVTFLGMTELGKEQMMASDPARGRMMVNLFRGIAFLMVPFTMNFNSAVFVYWTTNNTWSFFQAMVLKQPAVKKYFGIWDPPKPVPGQDNQIGSMIEEVKKMMEKKKEKPPNALDNDRVKAHNQIIEQQKKVVKKLREKEDEANEGLLNAGTKKRRSGGRRRRK